MAKSLLQCVSEYLVRICVFQVGEYKRGPISRFLIRLLKKRYDLFDKNVALIEKEFEEGICLFEKLGGVRFFKTSQDGQAQIDGMLLIFENVRKKIEQMGGKWMEAAVVPESEGSIFRFADPSDPAPHFLHAIYAETETPEWNGFFHDVLCAAGWEKATLEFPDKTREIVIAAHFKQPPPKAKKGCFLRCHSPGRSYGMEKKYTVRHLGIKKDVCHFDYRGTHRSTGKPSEGGYYLDAETVMLDLLRSHGYRPEEVWATGFCLGGAVAAHLKEKYHGQGIHFVGENTFTSLLSVIENQRWPAPPLGRMAMGALQDPAIDEGVVQDGFNTVEKFNRLPYNSKSGTSIVINTDADAILPKNSGEKLFSAALKSGPAYKILHRSSGVINPHADRVFDEKRVWNLYLEIIS